MRHWKTALAALVMLAAACGGDTATETTAPDITIERPTVNTEAPPPIPTTLQEEPETVTSEPENTATETETPPAETVECPEGTVPVEGGCQYEPEEIPASEDVATDDTGVQEECEASGGVWDADTLTCAEIDMEETTEGEAPDTDVASEAPEIGTDGAEDPPVRVVVYEGIASEDKCLVAGATWIDNQCFGLLLEDLEAAGVFVNWHPVLMDDAYEAVDPEAVGADRSERLNTGGPWGIYNYHFFYHYDDLEDEQIQYQIMREAASYAVRWVFIPLTEWVWFPHRYDISWTDGPNIVAITGTYPLGDQRTLLLHTDPEQRSGRADIELPLPLPPPIRPTTPSWSRSGPKPPRVWGGTARR